MEKSVVILFIFLSVFFMSIINISALGCSIINVETSPDYNPDKVLMGVSNPTNAHGEEKDQGIYSYVVQCEFAGGVLCDGSNQVISISSPTNAHAEISGGSYTIPICFGDLSCISTDQTSNDDYRLPILSLSADTNAHIGNFEDYPIKILCRSPTVPIAFWSVTNGVKPTSLIDVVPDTTKVQIIFENSGLIEGTKAIFEIFESDVGETLRGDDDFIKSIEGTVGVGGDVLVEWKIAQDNLNKGKDLFEDETELKFYFEAHDDIGNSPLATSSNLEINVLSSDFCITNEIFICGDYDPDQCSPNSDPCNVADNNPASDCTNSLTNCFCDLNDQSLCTDIFESIIINEEGFKEVLGQCVIDTGDGAPDNCDDGFITYSWTATWSESIACTSDSECLNEQICDISEGEIEGICKPSSCLSGKQTLQCPAQIQLPFFGLWNFIAAMLTIALIYGFMILRKKE